MATAKKSIKCVDETGHQYDSLLEMGVTHEFELYAQQGLIENINKQVCFGFKEKIGLARTYTADFTFDCLITFKCSCIKKTGTKWHETFVVFEAGKSYVVDVKSPLTYNMPTWRLKKALMKCTWGISVIELVRRHPRKTGSQKRKIRKRKLPMK